MKNLTLLLLLTIASTLSAEAQTPPAPAATIEKVEVAGIADQRLSADLRNALQRLAGQRYDATATEQIANRIQTEVPGVVAAPRVLPGSDAAHVRVVFVVGRTAAPNSGVDSNVNSQYVVDAVEVKGLERSQYSNALYEEMQKMVGQMMDNSLADDLRARLSAEGNKQYFITQKIERASLPGHIKVVFEAKRAPWLYRATIGHVMNANVNFGNGNISIGTPNRDKDDVEAVEVSGIPSTRLSAGLNAEMQMMVGKQVDHLEINHLLEKLKHELNDDYAVKADIAGGTKANMAKVVYKVELVPWLPYGGTQAQGAYHQKQGVSFVCCNDSFITKYSSLHIAFDGDTLTERYKGMGFALEGRQLVTRHFGARIEFDSYGVQWKDQTRRAIATSPTLPGLYRSREVVAPSVAYAFDRHLYVTAGANLEEVEMEGPATHWQSVHEGIASIHYDSKLIKLGNASYQSTANYEVRSGARNIGSAFSFTRHEFEEASTAKVGKNTLKFSMMAGKITGNAPLFERFSLGNTQTLRGWNKYDIDPLGGDRVWHSSIAYQISGLGIFLDQGAVWGNGLARKNRQSVGLTLGNAIGIGMPINCAGHCGITFFANFR